jgi:hypothetical protein
MAFITLWPIHSHDIKTTVNTKIKFEHLDILAEHPQE